MQDKEEFDRCIPSNLTNGQLCSISAKYIVSHPEKWSYSGSSLIPTAITEAFGCKFYKEEGAKK
jgi:Rap1a immunity proteins